MLLAGAAAALSPALGQAAPPGILAVLASSELQSVFPHIDAGPEYSFADSDLLANSLRFGVHADVFAAEGAAQPQALARAGKIGRPVVFATLRLVLIVPRRNPAHVTSASSLRRKGVSVLLGDPTLSFGEEARAVLSRLRLSSVLQRARGGAKTPQAMVAAVAAGHADAAIVYTSEAAAAKGRVRVIAIPARGDPTVPFEIAAVTGSRQPTAAAAFIHRVLSPSKQSTLRAAGFGPA